MSILKYKQIMISTIILIFLVQLSHANKTPSQTSLIENVEYTGKQSNQPDYEQIKKKIIDIVAKQLGIESKDVDVDVLLSKQKVAADELDAVEIVMDIEETFNVEIEDEIGAEWEDNHKKLSVKKLADIVFEKKKPQARVLGTFTNRYKMVNKYVLVAKGLSEKELVEVARNLHRTEPLVTFFFLDDGSKFTQMLEWVKDYEANKSDATDPIFKWMTEHIVANLQQMTGGGRGKYWALSKGMGLDEIADIK